MRAFIPICAGVAVAVLLVAHEIPACGDKFLVSGPSVQYGQLHSTIASTILIYRNPESSVASSVLDSSLEFALELAGHRIKTVRTPEEFQAAVDTGEYSVVLGDVSDIASVPSETAVVLPVTDEETEEHRVVRSSAKPSQIVSLINEALGGH